MVSHCCEMMESKTELNTKQLDTFICDIAFHSYIFDALTSIRHENVHQFIYWTLVVPVQHPVVPGGDTPREHLLLKRLWLLLCQKIPTNAWHSQFPSDRKLLNPLSPLQEEFCPKDWSQWSDTLVQRMFHRYSGSPRHPIRARHRSLIFFWRHQHIAW